MGLIEKALEGPGLDWMDRVQLYYLSYQLLYYDTSVLFGYDHVKLVDIIAELHMRGIDQTQLVYTIILGYLDAKYIIINNHNLTYVQNIITYLFCRVGALFADHTLMFQAMLFNRGQVFIANLSDEQKLLLVYQIQPFMAQYANFLLNVDDAAPLYIRNFNEYLVNPLIVAGGRVYNFFEIKFPDLEELATLDDQTFIYLHIFNIGVAYIRCCKIEIVAFQSLRRSDDRRITADCGILNVLMEQQDISVFYILLIFYFVAIDDGVCDFFKYSGVFTRAMREITEQKLYLEQLSALICAEPQVYIRLLVIELVSSKELHKNQAAEQQVIYLLKKLRTYDFRVQLTDFQVHQLAQIPFRLLINLIPYVSLNGYQIYDIFVQMIENDPYNVTIFVPKVDFSLINSLKIDPSQLKLSTIQIQLSIIYELCYNSNKEVILQNCIEQFKKMNNQQLYGHQNLSQAFSNTLNYYVERFIYFIHLLNQYQINDYGVIKQAFAKYLKLINEDHVLIDKMIYCQNGCIINQQLVNGGDYIIRLVREGNINLARMIIADNDKKGIVFKYNELESLDRGQFYELCRTFDMQNDAIQDAFNRRINEILGDQVLIQRIIADSQTLGTLYIPKICTQYTNMPLEYMQYRQKQTSVCLKSAVQLEACEQQGSGASGQITAIFWLQYQYLANASVGIAQLNKRTRLLLNNVTNVLTVQVVTEVVEVAISQVFNASDRSGNFMLAVAIASDDYSACVSVWVNGDPVLLHQFEVQAQRFDSVTLLGQYNVGFCRVLLSRQILPYALMRYIFYGGHGRDLSWLCERLGRNRQAGSSGNAISLLENVCPKMLEMVTLDALRNENVFVDYWSYTLQRSRIYSNMSAMAVANSINTDVQDDMDYSIDYFNVEQQHGFKYTTIRQFSNFSGMTIPVSGLVNMNNDFQVFINIFRYFSSYYLGVDQACVILRDLLAVQCFYKYEYTSEILLLKKVIRYLGYKFQFTDTFNRTDIKYYTCNDIVALQDYTDVIVECNIFRFDIAYCVKKFSESVRSCEIDLLLGEVILLSNQLLIREYLDQVAAIILHTIMKIGCNDSPTTQQLLAQLTNYSLGLSNRFIMLLFTTYNPVVICELVNVLYKNFITSISGEYPEESRIFNILLMSRTVCVSYNLLDSLLNLDERCIETLINNAHYIELLIVLLLAKGTRYHIEYLMSSAAQKSCYAVLMYYVFHALLRLRSAGESETAYFENYSIIKYLLVSHAFSIRQLANVVSSVILDTTLIESLLNYVNYRIGVNIDCYFTMYSITYLLLNYSSYDKQDNYHQYITSNFQYFLAHKGGVLQLDSLISQGRMLAEQFSINNQNILIFYFFLYIQYTHIDGAVKEQVSNIIEDSILSHISNLLDNFVDINCVLVNSVEVHGDASVSVLQSYLEFLCHTPLFLLLRCITRFSSDGYVAVVRIIRTEVDKLIAGRNNEYATSYYRIMRFYIHCLYQADQTTMLGAWDLITQLIAGKQDNMTNAIVLDVIARYYSRDHDDIVVNLLYSTKESLLPSVLLVLLSNNTISAAVRDVASQIASNMKPRRRDLLYTENYLTRNARISLSDRKVLQALVFWSAGGRNEISQPRAVDVVTNILRVIAEQHRESGTEVCLDSYRNTHIHGSEYERSLCILRKSYTLYGMVPLLENDHCYEKYGDVFGLISGGYYEISDVLRNPFDEILYLFTSGDSRVLILARNYIVLVDRARLSAKDIYMGEGAVFKLHRPDAEKVRLFNHSHRFRTFGFTAINYEGLEFEEDFDYVRDVRYIDLATVSNINIDGHTIKFLCGDYVFTVDLGQGGGQVVGLQQNYARLLYQINEDSNVLQLRLDITPVFYYVDAEIKVNFLKMYLYSHNSSQYALYYDYCKRWFDSLQPAAELPPPASNELTKTAYLLIHSNDTRYVFKLLLKDSHIDPDMNMLVVMRPLEIMDKIHSSYGFYILEVTQ